MSCSLPALSLASAATRRNHHVHLVADIADETFVDIVHEHSEWYEIAREKHGRKPGVQTVYARCKGGGPQEQVSEWSAALLRAVREETKMPLEMYVYPGQKLIYEPLGSAGARTEARKVVGTWQRASRWRWSRTKSSARAMLAQWVSIQLVAG